ncbi:MAG: hypothetical protein H8E66_13740, partial [Planctomycetes bacterium]|nr:hypothetical protein [Planctomycetota bacterium]
TFVWTAGHGSDTVEGGSGANVLQATFTANADVVTLTANGLRADVTDGADTISTARVSQIDLNTLAETDTVTVNDLSATSVTLVNIAAGDDADIVEVDGTSAGDTVSTEEIAGTVEVTGLSAVVRITASETVRFDGNKGEDTLIGSGTTPSVDVAAGRITSVLTGNLDFINTESLLLHAGTSLSLTEASTFVHTPSAITDEGALEADALEVRYTGLASGDTIILSGNTTGDSLLAHGTNDDNTFTVSSTSVVLTGRATLSLTSLETITLESLDGNDSFDLTPGTATFNLHAGDPSTGSDSLTFHGQGAAVTQDLGAHSISESLLEVVVYSSIEAITVNHAAANFNLDGTVGPDDFLVTPLTTASVEIQLLGEAPAVTTSGMGTVTIRDNNGGSDSLTVVGTNADDSIQIDSTDVNVGTLKAVAYDTSNIESLVIDGLSGDDTFAVTPDANTPPIHIEGGDPIGGGTNGDQLNLLAGGAAVTFNTGPEVDEGSLVAGANSPVSYDHIEAIGAFTVTGGANISGTNDTDSITVIARDDTSHAGTDGERDFTVSVNNGIEVLFVDTPSLNVDALGGRDEITLRTPAPNDTEWDVDVIVIGGTPSDGDRLVVETPGHDSILYTPSASSPDDGTLLIDEATNDTTITINGISELVYDGEDGDDDLAVAFNGTNTYTVGQAVDAGRFATDTSLPIDFTNLGTIGSLTANSLGTTDVLRIEGTSLNDLFDVTGTTVQLNRQLSITHNLAASETVQIVGAGSNTDTADYTGQGAAIAIDLGSSSFVEAGFATIVYGDLSAIALDAAVGTIDVDGTSNADTFDVTPTGANTTDIVMNGVAPIVSTNNSGTLNIRESNGGSDEIIVHTTSEDDAIAVTSSAISLNGRKSIAYAFANIESIVVEAGTGNDTIEVTPDANTPVIRVDGGDPIGATPGDTLNIQASGQSVTLNTGPENDEGSVKVGTTKLVSFNQIEALGAFSVTSGATVAAGNDADVITVIARDSSTHAGTDGQQDFTVTVNAGFEALFRDTPSLIVNALGGSDEITVQTPAPNDAEWNVDLTVNGGTPSDGDRLAVETPGQDTAIYRPGATPDSGSLVIDESTDDSSITINEISKFVYDGEAGNDRLTVETLSGSDAVRYLRGAAIDAAEVMVGSALPIGFINLGAGASVSLTDASGSRVDSLTLAGDSGDDIFDLATTTGSLAFNSQLVIATPGVQDLTIEGHSGNDQFTVNAEQPYRNITLSGGDPAVDADRVVLNATDDATLVLGGPTATVSGGNLSSGVVSLPGIEAVSLNAGANNLVVDGTTSADSFIVSPIAANVATVQAEGIRPVVTTTNTGSLTINALGGGDDALEVQLSSASETVTVTAAVVQVTAGAALKAVNYTASNIDSLSLFGNAGDDIFNVTADVNTPTIFVDGGDPIGSTPGDTLNVTSGTTVVINLGPQNDEGTFEVGGSQPVNFDRMESLGALNTPGGATVNASNGDDAISIIARDNSTHAGTNGIQDFTVEVNNGLDDLSILFTNTPTFTLNALGGNDALTVRTPAPNQAEWFVDLTITGGPGDDSVTLQTPGTDSVQIRPTGADTALIVIDEATNDSTITLSSLATSPGGIEHLSYDGVSGNDTLTIVGDGTGAGTADTIVRTVGVAADKGNFRVNSLLAVEYRNVGLGATLNVDGGAANAIDRLVQPGTSNDDEFAVEAGGIGNRVGLTGFLDVFTTNIESLTLLGVAGDDAFTIATTTAFANINLEGNDAGQDVLNVSASDGVIETFRVTHDILGSGRVTKTVATPLQIDYTALEAVTVIGNGVEDVLTVEGTTTDDQLQLVRGQLGDRVVGDSQIPVEAIGSFDTLTVDMANASGNDTLTVDLTRLVVATTYGVVADLSEVDRVVLLGTNAADEVTSTTDSVTVSQGTRTGTIEFTPGQLDLVTIQTFDGADDVTLTSFDEPLRVEVGAGDDNVDLSLSTGGTTVGGEGDDVLRGGSGPDTIDGGPGDDQLFGMGDADLLRAGDGNDVILGGFGADRVFGGAGSDLMVWNPGDGSDVVEGEDGLDVLQLSGGNVPDEFTLSASVARLQLDRVSGAASEGVDAAGIEQVDLNISTAFGTNVTDLAGADMFVVNDLSQTEVEILNLGLGLSDNEPDEVKLNGRSTADTVAITGGAAINVGGLAYDINITGGAANEDSLTFNSNGGDDTIDVADLSGSFSVDDVVIDGGQGHDTITGFGNLRGNVGNDVLTGDASSQILEGGDGADQLFGLSGEDDLRGGIGEDLMIGGTGNDTIDGMDGFDTILIEGTSARDIIDVRQPTDAQLVHTVNGVTETDTLVSGSVEQASVDALGGDDLVRVLLADQLFDDAGRSLQIAVAGGSSTGIGDQLIIVDDGTDDLTLYRKGVLDSEGRVTIGPANIEPLEHVFTGIERLQLVDENGAALNAGSGDAARLVVFKHDPFESNEDRFTATLLGANETVNVDPTIDPAGLVNPFGDGFDIPGDSDWYRIEAVTTGTIDVQVLFEEIALIGTRPGLPGDGNLDIELYDIDGTLIAGNGTFGDNDGAHELDTDGDAFEEDERIRIPAVDGQTYFLRVAGRTVDVINSYSITVINEAPPTPFDIELQDTPVGAGSNSDDGRTQTDNVTRDGTPTIFFRLDDGVFRFDVPGNDTVTTPVDQLIPIPFQTTPQAGFRIAIFDEGPTPNQSATAPQTPVGFATETGTDGLYTFTFPTALSEGTHFLSARVEMIDPATPQQAGFGPRSQSLEILVDTSAPNISFGDPSVANDGIDPSDGDTGVTGVVASSHDRVTSDTTPSFFGQVESDSIVRVYVDQNADGIVDAGDVLIGTTTATTSGSSQNPISQWQLTSTVDLNDPEYFSLDGVRRLLVTAEDPAGTVTAPEGLIIFVDTQGPRITGVDINTQGNSFSLFDPDPMDGPTPAVNSLVLSVEDLAARSNVDANFLYDAFDNGLIANAGHYSLIGDNSGAIPIASISFTPVAAADGQSATGTIRLTFAQPLPDDRFTLTVSDAVQDSAGNALDGESNATEPQGDPQFASGDGVPGTSFSARFTVDSRPEIGTATGGAVQVDANSNGMFDSDNSDAANRDFIYQIGTDTDQYFTGNFNTATMTMAASGFDKVGVYGQTEATQPGQTNPQYRFLLDFDHDGAADLVSVPTAEFQVPGQPVAGDFNVGHSGDEIGLLAIRSTIGAPLPNDTRPTRSYELRWILDTNGNNELDGNDTVIVLDQSTYPEIPALIAARQEFPINPLEPPTEVDLAPIFRPIVADFNGDGNDDLAIFDALNNQWNFDVDRDGQRDDVVVFGLPGETERPVAGDWNLDGIDDFGVFSAVPTSQTQPEPVQPADFRLLISDRSGAVPSAIFEPFAPTPLGNDESFEFGDKTEFPVFGNFDPPVSLTVGGGGDAGGGDTGGGTDVVSYQNATNKHDVNNDGQVSPLDALLIINALNQHGSGSLPDSLPSSSQYLPPNVYLDVDGDGFVAPGDVLRVINQLNNPSSEGEGEATQFSFVGATETSPASQPLDAANVITPAFMATTREAAGTVQEDHAAKSTIFQRVGSWLNGASERVASLLDQPSQRHRRLPAKIALPVAAAEFVAAEIDDAIAHLAADQSARKEDSKTNELDDAINDIFGDWTT